MSDTNPAIDKKQAAVDTLSELLKSADDSIKLQAAQTILHEANR